MPLERRLTVPEGYDAAANPRVASFAAQLDDQLSRLKKDVAGLEVRHLEWQPHNGINTIGMLLAHLAVVDVWWMRLAPLETPEAECDAIMRDTIGILMDDDGLPLAPEAAHPASLAGKSLEDYLAMIDRARAATHEQLRRWTDADLDTTFQLRDRAIFREWTAYHVLEHFCGHYGQILLLKHLLRDAGLLPKS
ncbi:MAG: DinB family protein [Candidatus Eisenbacteria bacterium]|uniref:DinB family protein n=1 Tax=Eiseniibacteriota bacterium TaxID=2212470 RepID=A0A956LYV1_UNCEI|nr:DinB family protein [Candidatus Eisenbacteria bacterium]